MYRKQVKYITNFEIHTCPASKTTSQGDVGQVEFSCPWTIQTICLSKSKYITTELLVKRKTFFKTKNRQQYCTIDKVQ